MKQYEDLEPLDELVAKVGPKMEYQGNKLVEVDPEREVIYTKAGYEAIDRDDAGNARVIPVEAIGTPRYSTGKNGVRTFKTVKFGEPDDEHTGDGPPPELTGSNTPVGDNYRKGVVGEKPVVKSTDKGADVPKGLNEDGTPKKPSDPGAVV